MLPVSVVVGPLVAAAANNIATSQSPAGAVAVTLNGSLVTAGVAILDVARRVLITSAADDRTVTFRITGTNSDGNPIRQTVTGSNGSTVASTADFKTVTEILTSGATTGAITVGTNGVAGSRWVIPDEHISPFNISLGVIISGTVNYTIEYTYDNPNDNQFTPGGSAGNYPTPPNVFTHSTIVTKTANFDGFITSPVAAWRLTLNSQTNPGYVTGTGIQAGMGR